MAEQPQVPGEYGAKGPDVSRARDDQATQIGNPANVKIPDALMRGPSVEHEEDGLTTHVGNPDKIVIPDAIKNRHAASDGRPEQLRDLSATVVGDMRKIVVPEEIRERASSAPLEPRFDPYASFRVNARAVDAIDQTQLDAVRTERKTAMIESLQRLDDHSYRRLIALSKGLTTLPEVAADPKCATLCSLLARTNLYLELLPLEFQEFFADKTIVSVPANRYPFAHELVLLTRVYCPGLGINVANANDEPGLPSESDADALEEIKIDREVITVQKRPSGLFINYQDTAGIQLEPGQTVTIGSGDYVAKTIFGVQVPEEQPLVRICDLKLPNTGYVSRASVSVTLDPSGKKVTVRDLGSRSSLWVVEKNRCMRYNPLHNKTEIRQRS